MKLDGYSFKLCQEHVDNGGKQGLSGVGNNPWCGSYPHVPDKAWINNHQASYFVSIHLIFVFIHTLSVLYGKARLQSTSDK